MNITITGNLGSGKTSVCKELKKFGFTIISAGDIFRDIAAEKGMTVIELNEAAKKDRSIDDLLDSRSTELGKKLDNTVFDSRLAWHFAEKSFKVFLLVDTQEAARRVFAGDRRSAEEYQDEDDARAGLESRARLEQERFQALYGLDYYDAGNYDLIIESSFATPEQIAQEIKRNFELFQEKPFSTKAELNLKSLYPSKRFQDMDKEMLAEYCRKEKEQNPSLCGMYSPCVAVKNGYHYLLEGHHHVFAAIAAGKVFAQIREIRRDAATQGEIMPLLESDIAGFEQAGNFRYRTDPVRMPEKTGYMVDFFKGQETLHNF